MMVVIGVEHTKESVRGILSRFMIEFRPGVFLGNLSNTTRKLLVKIILEADPDIDMVIAADKGQRIEYESYGNPTRKVVDYEGIELLQRDTSASAYNIFTSFMAKPDKTLKSHLYETGVITRYLLQNSMLVCDREELSKLTGLSPQEVVDFCSFLAAMHDIGKLAPAFQRNLGAMAEPTFSAILEDNDIVYDELENNYRHEVYSALLLREYVIDRIDEIKISKRKYLPGILQEHHQGNHKGHKAKESGDLPNGVRGNKKWEENVVIPFIDFVRQSFPVDEEVIKRILDNWNNAIFVLLTGIVILSDWLGSGNSFYGTEYDKEEYDNEIYAKLKTLLTRSEANSVKIDKNHTFTEMFRYPKPNLVQEKIINILNENPDFECMLIEDSMGGGKTEGALYTAAKSLIYTGKRSLYVALPTEATSSKMLDRVNDFLTALNIPEKASLMTGTSWLTNIGLHEEKKGLELVFRKHKLFSTVAVGTVDQIMTAAQNANYCDVRLSLLATKVVVIDEIHSYDAYMDEIIIRLLQYLRSYHVPVIMLSATLSTNLKKKLLSVYADTDNMSPAFPAITVCRNNEYKVYKCPIQNGKKHRLIIENVNSVTDKAEEIVKTAAQNACVGVIVNTVDTAIQLFNDVTKKIKDDTPVYLLHSRMPIQWKEDRTKEIVDIFGKDAKENGKRPERAIVIATSIIEMSVDVDFDCLYTQLAPSDALLQRIGRESRHDDHLTAREKGFLPFTKILCLNSSSYKEEERNSLPYDPEILKRSKKVIKEYNEISVPEDILEIIDKTYEGLDETMDRIREKKASVKLLSSPDERNIQQYFANKGNYVETRYQEYDTYRVFMGSDTDYDKIVNGNGDIKEYAEIYMKSIITVAWNDAKGLPFIQNSDRCRQFDDIHDGRTAYILDKKRGLLKGELIWSITPPKCSAL